MKEIKKDRFFQEGENKLKLFGSTREIDNEYGSGYCWTCNIEDNFIISIDEIEFKEDFPLDFVLPNLYVLVLYIRGSGDEFYPYQTISPNTLRCYEPQEDYQVIYHPQVQLKAISIEFTAEFLNKYIEEKCDGLEVNFDDFFKDKRKLYLPELNKLMLEIYSFDAPYSIAKFYLEAKLYEALAIISYYLQAGKDSLNALTKADDRDLEAMEEIASYIDKHFNFDIPLETLAKIACMSQSKLKKLFKSYFHMPITEYIQRQRLSTAEHLLIGTDLPIKEISKIVGYSNPSRFTELFKRYYGLTPSNYR